MELKSTAFAQNGSIPVKYTCEGEDISPPLEWDGLPENTRSLALIVDDPDAPDPRAPRQTWVHWVVYNIPPQRTGLPEGVKPGTLPLPSVEGMNDWHRLGYGGPCPPIGEHRYFHKLYALDTDLPETKRAGKSDIEKLMKGHVLAQAQLVGLYQKGRKR